MQDTVELKNGLRTYRPSLDRYIFCSPSIESQVQQWIEGVRNGKASRNLMLTGPTGHGKTTLALAACQALGAVERDILEVNCANFRTLDDARGLIETSLSFAPVGGNYRVLILDEVHQMVANAQQAFLTPLEQLSDHTLVIACTTHPEQLAPAFRGRFYEIKLQTYTEEQILEILENLPELTIKPKQKVLIAQLAMGNPRRAIALAEAGLDENQEEVVRQEVMATDHFLAGLLAQDNKVMYLSTKLINQENKATFFEKTLRNLDAAYQMKLGLMPVLPRGELLALQELLKKYPWNGQALAEIYAELLQVSTESPQALKIWVLKMAARS